MSRSNIYTSYIFSFLRPVLKYLLKKCVGFFRTTGGSVCSQMESAIESSTSKILINILIGGQNFDKYLGHFSLVKKLGGKGRTLEREID